MKRLAAVLTLLSVPALAQETVYQGGDIITLRESSEGHVAELYYSNAGEQSSNGGVDVVEWNGVRVGFRVEVKGDETIRVFPEDETMIAVPDRADVPDGEGIVIQIMLPMF